MRIAVIGANGKTGRLFVNLALQAGHHITAAVHNKNTLPDNANLSVIKCDTTDLDQVNQLVVNQDAVVSFIGHARHSSKDVQTKTINNVITAMRAHKIRRLISLTGTGVRFPGDQITLTDRLLNLSISVIDPDRIKDGIQHVRAIQQTDLDWTIIRVLKLTNGPAHKFSLKDNGPTKIFISRHEVAEAALELLKNNSHIQKAPIIGRVSK